MKKIILLLSVMFISLFTYSQEHVIKLNVNEIAFGKYEISYERTFNEGLNRIKPSGRLARPFSNKSIQLKNNVWPNIMTKSTLNITAGMILNNIEQDFGTGLSAKNASGNNINITRSTKTSVSGFVFDVEYRNYFKTFYERIGDPPRGFYFAPFIRFATISTDFDDLTDSTANNLVNYLINNGNNSQAAGKEWRDVSFKQDNISFGGGIAIGRQWLIKNKFSIDTQVGVFYNIFTQQDRLFNGNDTWNANGTFGVGNDTDFENKFGDVYNISDADLDPERTAYYNDIVDADGLIAVRNKGGAESELKFTDDFHRELNGITDFAKWYTYRIKIRLGYAF